MNVGISRNLINSLKDIIKIIFKGNTMSNSTEKDTHSMGIRLNQEQHQQLIELSEHLGFNRSKVIKYAINRLYQEQMSEIASKFMLLEKSTILQMTEKLKPEDMKKIGEHSAQNHLVKIRQRLMKHHDIPISKTGLLKFLDFFSQILSNKHWKWIDDMSPQFQENNQLILFITHDINRNFSYFLKILMENIVLHIFSAHVIEDSVILADNQLELHFTFDLPE